MIIRSKKPVLKEQSSNSLSTSIETPRKSGRPKKETTFSVKLTPAKATTKKKATPKKSPKTKKSPKSSSPKKTRTTEKARATCTINGIGLSHNHNLFADARRLLHPSAVPEVLSCRNREFNDIYRFVKDALIQDNGACMYISGVPGTGKTATVLEVIKQLSHPSNKEVPKFQFIEVNGLKLTDPNQFYSHVYFKLTGQKSSKQISINYLDSYFSKPNYKNDFIIMLVDELDLLCTKRQNILYHLFDWPNRPNSRLVILSIANTMDLPERIMINRVSSRLGLTRLTFQPYSFTELQEIVNGRIKTLNLFDQDGIQLIARKVAAISGDARRVLDICRRAVDVAEQRFDTLKPGVDERQSVKLVDVNNALKAIFSSEKLTAIREASEQQKIFLESIVTDFRISGLEEAVFGDVYRHHYDNCAEKGIYKPSVTEVLQIAYDLHEIRLILVDRNLVDFAKRIRLNVSIDDINFVLKSKAD